MSKAAVVAILSVASFSGCQEVLDAAGGHMKKSPNSIIGKKTQDIKKFDAAAGDVPQERSEEITSMATASLEIYQRKVVEIHTLHVDYALKLYRAEHDRFPKDYDEFMSAIIKRNNIRLPVLPGELKYAYDEENHRLMVIKNTDIQPEPAQR